MLHFDPSTHTQKTHKFSQCVIIFHRRGHIISDKRISALATLHLNGMTMHNVLQICKYIFVVFLYAFVCNVKCVLFLFISCFVRQIFENGARNFCPSHHYSCSKSGVKSIKESWCSNRQNIHTFIPLLLCRLQCNKQRKFRH